MNVALTKRKSPAQRRAEAAARTERWREKNSGRPDPRLVDRMLLEGLFHVLGETPGMTLDARSLIVETVDAAVSGLKRKGYRGGASRQAVGRRIGDHQNGTCVRAALSEKAMWRDLEAARMNTV
ncbi:hypothetical protein [Aurantimonas coralicida]|uniref:hypothetical protein n=1 Tax=Aurantimonas coralicida TaxID=182270 RepID=UPI00238E88EC|nr:hypothetical protein [Aurantimonas coralicida]MDE0925400.1 hypothetical protein [Aurantimonas coralicida]